MLVPSGLGNYSKGGIYKKNLDITVYQISDFSQNCSEQKKLNGSS